MEILTILFTLSFLFSAVNAEEYCYYDSYNYIVCRDRLSIGIRVAIAVVSFLVVSGILLAIIMYRRRRTARLNLAFVQTAQQQPQLNQYPPQTFLGGNGQKAPGFDSDQQQTGQYNPQQTGQYTPQYNGQYTPQYTGQQDPQYTGQYHPQYNAPQYPPASYDQNQTAPPYPNVTTPPQR